MSSTISDDSAICEFLGAKIIYVLWFRPTAHVSCLHATSAYACMYVYIYMYVCMYVCMYRNVCMHVPTCGCMYAGIFQTRCGITRSSTKPASRHHELLLRGSRLRHQCLRIEAQGCDFEVYPKRRKSFLQDGPQNLRVLAGPLNLRTLSWGLGFML